MSLPLVSVIVASYRRSTTLIKALDSIASQTYENFEIIIVDDNGDKEWNRAVENIVNDFKMRCQSVDIKYIVNPGNFGIAKTRRIGVEAAKGEYVTFLDDDDLYLPKKIETQVTEMIRENADYSITDLYLYHENDKLSDKRVRSYIIDYSEKALIEYHMKYHFTGPDVLMFRKEYLVSIGNFGDIDIGEDFYLMMNAIKGGGKFCYLPECHVKAYIHTGEGGLSSGMIKIEGENTLHKFKKKYFPLLSNKTRKYIRVRHRAVLSFAYLRMGKYINCIVQGVLAFLISPASFIDIVSEKTEYLKE